MNGRGVPDTGRGAFGFPRSRVRIDFAQIQERRLDRRSQQCYKLTMNDEAIPEPVADTATIADEESAGARLDALIDDAKARSRSGYSLSTAAIWGAICALCGIVRDLYVLLREGIAELATQVATAASASDDLAQRVAHVSSIAGNADGRVKAMTADIGALAGRVTSLEQETSVMDALNERVTRIGKAESDLRSHVNSLYKMGQAGDRVNDRLDALEAASANHGTRHSVFADKQRKEFDALASRIEERFKGIERWMSSQLDNHITLAADLNERISKLETSAADPDRLALGLPARPGKASDVIDGPIGVTGADEPSMEPAVAGRPRYRDQEYLIATKRLLDMTAATPGLFSLPGLVSLVKDELSLTRGRVALLERQLDELRAIDAAREARLAAQSDLIMNQAKHMHDLETAAEADRDRLAPVLATLEEFCAFGRQFMLVMPDANGIPSPRPTPMDRLIIAYDAWKLRIAKEIDSQDR